jgi:hypothetical protein
MRVDGSSKESMSRDNNISAMVLGNGLEKVM